MPIDPLNGDDDDEVFLLTLRKQAPKEVRSSIASLLLGMSMSQTTDNGLLTPWRRRLIRELDGLDLTTPEGSEAAVSLIEIFRTEFLARVVSKQRYRAILRVWGATALLLLAVQLVLGPGCFLDSCSDKGTQLCMAIYGHLDGYIAFRYALFGLLLGNALAFSYRSSVVSLDEHYRSGNLLERPALNILVGSALSYLLARLVVAGTLSFDLFGLHVQATDGTFTDSGALFFIGLSACIAADVYLRRLIESARGSAEKVFGTGGAE